MLENIQKDDLVEMAVTFFSNPDVRKYPFSQQEEFLKKKGLTTEQIKTAYEKSFSHVINVPAVQNAEIAQPANFALRVQKLKNLFSTLAVLVGASYGFYYLYKKFVKPFLFGKPKKPKSIDSSINNLSQAVEKSVGDLRTDVQLIRNELKKVILLQSDQHRNIMHLGELKSDVATLKSILLTRHEYAKMTIPSIPSWQLRSDPLKREKEDKGNVGNEEGEHHGGPCETECGANPNSNGGSQGSDSSLEMIKEVDA